MDDFAHYCNSGVLFSICVPLDGNLSCERILTVDIRNYRMCIVLSLTFAACGGPNLQGKCCIPLPLIPDMHIVYLLRLA